MPVARRVLGESNDLTFKMRKIYANTLYADPDSPLSDVREAVETLAEMERTARRVFGGAHPNTAGIEGELQKSRAVLHARESWIYARTLYGDGASLDDLRESVTTLEDADRIARRVFGGAHPNVVDIERELQDARAALRARETPSSPSGSA